MFGRHKIGKMNFAVAKLVSAVDAKFKDWHMWKPIRNGITIRCVQTGTWLVATVIPAGWPDGSLITCNLAPDGTVRGLVTVRAPHLRLEVVLDVYDSGHEIALGDPVLGTDD